MLFRSDPIWKAIESFINPHTRGEPESSLQWISKSLRNIEAALKEKGISVSHRIIGDALKEHGFSFQSNRKRFEGSSHEDRVEKMGIYYHNTANSLLITADGGGSNSSKGRLWKHELQKFANETGMTIEVAHFPPGTSKWNKIEHRLFSFI